MTTFTQDQIEATKPTDRGTLKKAITGAAGKFEDKLIQVGQKGAVAVGRALVEFDDQDADRLIGSIEYSHGQAARSDEQAAILGELCALLTPDRIGPLGCHVELMGAASDGVRYSVDFRVRCPAAA